MVKEIMIITWSLAEFLLRDIPPGYIGDYARCKDLEEEIERFQERYEAGEPLVITFKKGDNFTCIVDGYHAIRHFRDGIKEHHLDGVLYDHVSVPITKVTLDEDLQRNTFIYSHYLLAGATPKALEESRFIAPSVARYMRSQGFYGLFVWYNHQTELFDHESECVKALNIKWIRNAEKAINEIKK